MDNNQKNNFKQACFNARQNWKQIDSLRMGMDWDEDDINKPQILIDDVWGTTHPGNYHLDKLTKQAGLGIHENGGKPTYCHVTDVCDGCAMGHDGMNYILLSRELITDMVEVHASYIPFDGLILISGCDKSVPAHLKAAGRLDLPTIHIPGGSMRTGPNLMTSLKTGELSAKDKKGETSTEEIRDYKLMGTPSCGSCQVMGTASTMQCMSESLGMALPGSALAPSTLQLILRNAKLTGKQILSLREKDISAKDILVKEAFMNALKVHAAIAGSTNALIHIPAIAHEVDIKIEPVMIDEINKEIPYITNILPSGDYPTEFLWFAGGVPMIQWMIKDYLDLDVMTVTGNTLRENLENLKNDGFFRRANGMLKNYGLARKDVIKSPVESNRKGSVAVLKGNIAPEGSVVKYSAVAEEMHNHIGRAVVFDSEEECHSAIVNNEIDPGSVLIIRYEGPKGSGMPEMYMTTDALVADDKLNKTTAIITDGRFSGFSSGPCIGHITPEAAEGGPIALIENDDIIKIDIPNRKLNIIGINGERLSKMKIKDKLEKRIEQFELPRKCKTHKGALKRYTDRATSAMFGAYTK